MFYTNLRHCLAITGWPLPELLKPRWYFSIGRLFQVLAPSCLIEHYGAFILYIHVRDFLGRGTQLNNDSYSKCFL